MHKAGLKHRCSVMLKNCLSVFAWNRLPGPAAGSAVDNAAAPSSRWRREILDSRLEVDAPRVCTHTGGACTMWSFCGSVGDEASAVVERNDVSDCPYPPAPLRDQRLKR